MKLKMKKLMKNRKGFTLVELIVVIVILGLLMLFLLPVIGDAITKAEERSFQMARQRLHEAALMCSLEFPHKEIVWASHQGGELANKSKEITEANLHEAWYKYFDKYPENPIDKSVDFTVHIYKDGTIEVFPETP